MTVLQIIFIKQQIFLPTWGVMQLLILLLRPILFIVIQYHLHMLYVAMLLFVLKAVDITKKMIIHDFDGKQVHVCIGYLL